MNLPFLIAFIVCLASYIFHTVLHILEYKGYKFVGSKPSHAILSVMIFIGYSAWACMIAWDPTSIRLSSYAVLPLGLVIGLIGLVIVLVSIKTKKGFGEVDHLVTTGIYSKIRNPMYLSIILMHIGFPLAAKRLLTLVSAIIWIPLVLIWKYMEEQNLEKKFGAEYSEYKRRTWF